MKILGLVPFNIIPANFGGAERALNLLAALGSIKTIALNWEAEFETTYGEMTYQVINADPEAHEQANKIFGQAVYTMDGVPAFTAKNQNKLKAAIADYAPDLIVLEHPWLYPFVGDTPYIYDAHNAEAFLTSLRWPGSIDEQIVRELEEAAVKNARAITYCSELDAQILRETYKPTAPMHYVANGTDLPPKLAEGKTRNLIFIGSNYGPNVRAAQSLADNAPDNYNVQILGLCAKQVRTNRPNVELIGFVDDDTMDKYLANAYAFVNLMHTGSGTSLKVARAMSYGLPIITTKVGGRGYNGVIMVNQPNNLSEALEYLANDWDQWHSRSREYAETISWEGVGATFRQIVYAEI